MNFNFLLFRPVEDEIEVPKRRDHPLKQNVQKSKMASKVSAMFRDMREKYLQIDGIDELLV